jgi:hypothetical protein
MTLYVLAITILLIFIHHLYSKRYKELKSRYNALYTKYIELVKTHLSTINKIKR